MHTLSEIPDLKQLEGIIPKFKALIWDMDGTIVQSEHIHALTTMETIKELGNRGSLNIEIIEQVCTGQTDKFIYDYLCEQEMMLSVSLKEFINCKNKRFQLHLDSIELSSIFNPAIKNLLRENTASGIKQVVVTSSEKEIADLVLSHLEIEKYFDFVISREDTLKNKPSPEPYYKAIKELKTLEKDIIIFEDSLTGLTAARETNANIFKVTWYEP